jgi:hypothetical protein
MLCALKTRELIDLLRAFRRLMDQFVDRLGVSSGEDPPSIVFSRVENNCHWPVSRCLMPAGLPPLPETGKFGQCGYSLGTSDKAADPGCPESPTR